VSDGWRRPGDGPAGAMSPNSLCQNPRVCLTRGTHPYVRIDTHGCRSTPQAAGQRTIGRGRSRDSGGESSSEHGPIPWAGSPTRGDAWLTQGRVKIQQRPKVDHSKEFHGGERDRQRGGRVVVRSGRVAGSGCAAVSADAVGESRWADDAGVHLSESCPALAAARRCSEHPDRVDR
jgi:hypothetical protein